MVMKEFSGFLQLIFISAAIILMLILAGATIGIKRNYRRKTEYREVTNRRFTPFLPVSNIIKHKMRKTSICSTSKDADNRRVFLRLVEVLGGKVIKINKRKGITIGTSRKCSITVEDNTVAPLHCSIMLIDGQLYVMDHNTKNGTLLNGVKIKDIMPLYVDDLILMGSTEYKVESIILS